MPLYNERSIKDTIDKTQYERAHRIELLNPLNGVPKMVMRTSWVERDNETGVETQQASYRILEDLYAPDEAFDVVDAGGNVVGQATHATLMGILYGLFFHMAAKEDT